MIRILHVNVTLRRGVCNRLVHCGACKKNFVLPCFLIRNCRYHSYISPLISSFSHIDFVEKKKTLQTKLSYKVNF